MVLKMRPSKKLLEKYDEESDHITVEQKDPVVNPKFTSEYTSDDVAANSLIVVCGDRSKVEITAVFMNLL